MAKPSQEPSASTTLPMVNTNSAYYIHASDYPRAYELKRELTLTRQDRDSVSAYYTRLQGLWNESNSISPLPKCACGLCTCGIGKKLMEVKEREQMYEFLMGLDDSYGVVKTHILTMNPTPTLEAAYHLVSEDERQRLVSTGRRQVSDEAAALQVQPRQAIIAGETAAALDTKPHNNGAKESEKEKVRSLRQRILEWQGKVTDRLQALNRRSGSSSINKSTLTQTSTATAAPSISNTRKIAVQKLSSVSRTQTAKSMNSKSVQDSLQSTLTRTSTATAAPSAVQKSSSVSQTQTAKSINSNSVPKPSGYQDSLVEMINSLIVDRSPSVKWEDIAGLEKAKQALMEMVILPTKRKDLFTRLRRPAKGLLLFGPPGSGKTMLAKAVASESQATFFSVSASSLTSKWVGEGEKLVQNLFTVASSRQPSVIFIDEIDSILSSRRSNEHEFSRRLKSEFLVQFDGVTSNSNDLVIVIGATNKPQDLDDAVLRRLVKKIYIPLPDANGRRLLLKHKLKGQAFSLPDGDLERLVADTEGYSGSDLQALCEEAAMIPIREFGPNILTVKENQVRGLGYGDFEKAMSDIRPSLQKSKWKELEEWSGECGTYQHSWASMYI